jgi:hypothetical protein
MKGVTKKNLNFARKFVFVHVIPPPSNQSRNRSNRQHNQLHTQQHQRHYVTLPGLCVHDAPDLFGLIVKDDVADVVRKPASSVVFVDRLEHFVVSAHIDSSFDYVHPYAKDGVLGNLSILVAPSDFGLFLDPSLKPLSGDKQAVSNAHRWKPVHLHNLVHFCRAYADDLSSFPNTECQFFHSFTHPFFLPWRAIPRRGCDKNQDKR